jgi:nicotinamide mononucleotide transporter
LASADVAATVSAWLDSWWQPAFNVGSIPVTWAEVLAVLLSLWMVERNIRVHVLAWPLAIASALIYLALFQRSGLYGEAMLQLMFVAVSVWGWWMWAKPKRPSSEVAEISYLTVRKRVILASLTLAAWPALGWLLARHTDSTVPYLDALPTVASVTAQGLLGRKVVDNWPLWVGVNIFSVGLFAHKGLWLTAALYGVFAVLAVIGWRAWQRLAAQQTEAQPA